MEDRPLSGDKLHQFMDEDEAAGGRGKEAGSGSKAAGGGVEM